MTPTTATPFLPRWILLSLAVLLLVLAAVFLTGALSADWSPFSAQSEDGSQVPAKPTGLGVATEQGSLDVSADWDDVEGADDYLVRWRLKGGRLNVGTRVNSSSAAITVDDYGEWVVRVQACNDAGCGKPVAKQFRVEPDPEPTPTPAPETTPEPTPEPTPQPTTDPTPEPAPAFQVSITAASTEIDVEEEVTLTAVITNAPSGQAPRYQWQLDLGGGSWYSSGTGVTFSYLQSNAGSTAFRVTVTYGSGASTTSDPITITWVPPNRAPVVNDQAEQYAGFTGADSAPRGTLVSKLYGGIFSDPDGDTLTYTVSVPADRSGLVDTVYIQESTQRVFIRLDAEDDWGAVTPALPKPLVITVTLTATDPDGLASSVTGEFRTDWEGGPALLAVCDRTPQVRDALVEHLGKDCENIGAEDLAQVVKLDLSNKGLSSLKSRDFSGMISLRDVDVSSNTFASWTDACAAKYGDSVQNINLSYNYLGGTGAGIPSGCFTSTKFPNLKSLHLAGNRINSLAGNPFSGLSNLYWLDLSQNQIASLPTTAAFQGLSGLVYLNLGRNSLSSVKLNQFGWSTKLEWLALNNQFAQDADNNFEPTGNALLTSLDVQAFGSLSSLKELDLANNGITSIGLPNNVFSPLSSLESLALFGNPGAPWTATKLKDDLKVRAEASVIQVVTPPSGFTVEPVSGGVKLTWDDPGDTTISHQYRAMTTFGIDASIDWTDISSPTTSGSKLEHIVSSGLTSGRIYNFLLRSEKNGAHSYHAHPDGCTALFGTSGNDTLNGDEFGNCIIGLAGKDTLEGGVGADKLDGGAGTDTVSYSGSPEGVIVNLSTNTATFPDDGDSIDSHANGDEISNFENITGSASNDTLTGDGSANVLTGGAGADEIDGGAGTDTANYKGAAAGVTVNLSDDTASGGDAEGDSLDNIENITGTGLNDTLTGDGSANVLTGGRGNDMLEGLAGADRLWGEAGNDTLSYASSDAAVNVDLAAGTASGGHAAGDSWGGIENLISSAHADTLTGSAKDNVIEGGAGGDTLSGGFGADTLSYASSHRPVSVSFADNTAEEAHAEGDTISGFERFLGSDGGDWFEGDANDNVIYGSAGRDEYDGGAGNDTLTYASFDTGAIVNVKDEGDIVSNIEIIYGTRYYDTLNGDSVDNTISGGEGNDFIGGGAGDDNLNGGNGNDHITGGSGADTIDGGSGGDMVYYRGSSAAVTVNLTTGINTGGHAQGDTLTNINHIVGSSHNDTLTGDEDVNYFYGEGGADALDGKGGTDWALYFAGGCCDGITLDMVTPAISTGNAKGDTYTSIERIVGTEYNDTLTGNADDNDLSGYTGNDTIKGGGGDDIIYGGRGEDALHGDAGNDMIHSAVYGVRDIISKKGKDVIPVNGIWGGDGDDKLAAMEGTANVRGGTGTDEFYFMGALGSQYQVIYDYASGEKIWICRGSGKGTADGEVSWTEAAGNQAGLPSPTDDWKITVNRKDGSDDVELGVIWLLGVSTSPGADIAWSDPAAAVGTGCNFIEPWTPWYVRDRFPPLWEQDN